MFGDHLAKMNALVEAHLGSPVRFIYGNESWERTPVPEGGDVSSRLNKSVRRIRGCNKTMELSLVNMPPAPIDALQVEEEGISYQVIDHDVDGGWVRLYLVAASSDGVDRSDDETFIFP